MQMTPQLQAALVPFLAMARACKYLPEHETIAARVANLRLVHLDAQDFRALALAVEQQQEIETAKQPEAA